MSWAEHSNKSKHCNEILDIYYFCADFMQETARRRRHLIKYYKYAPLIAEKIEASKLKNFFYSYLGFTLERCSHFIKTGNSQKAYKEFKYIFKKFVGEFGLKKIRGQK